MRPTLTLALLFALTGTLQADTAETSGAVFSDSILVVGDSVLLVPVPEGKSFEVAFKVGSLDIDARPVFDARLEVVATCPDVSPEYCEKRVSRLGLKTRELDDRVRVELIGMSRREMKKLGVEATIIVPERSPLIVKMGIGELEIDAGPENLEVGMSIGDLTVTAPSEGVGSVGISTRIGDASLRTVEDPYVEGKRRMLIGAKVNWSEGSGDSRIAVRLGIGDARVRLD